MSGGYGGRWAGFQFHLHTDVQNAGIGALHAHQSGGVILHAGVHFGDSLGAHGGRVSYAEDSGAQAAVAGGRGEQDIFGGFNTVISHG